VSGVPTPPRTPLPPDDDRKVGEMAFDVAERVSLLVREEVALAKVELTENVSNLIRGSVVGIAAGVFVLAGLAMLMHAIAWLINDLIGVDGAVWIGFGIEALLWFVVAAVAGLVAYKAVKKGSPPTPDMAIEEVKETKATLGRKA
jgi:uncharacterized membrane protein YqjE